MGASSAPTTPTRARAAWPHTHSTYTRESPGREGSGQSQARESEVASEGGGGTEERAQGVGATWGAVPQRRVRERDPCGTKAAAN